MRRYPPGFLTLSASVACERFSFFLLLSLLLLYLNERLGCTTASATDILGCFIAATYVSPLLGGIVSDGRLGVVRVASLGYLIAAVGYALLMIARVPTLYVGLSLVALGSGAAKSAPQALATRLYANIPEHRDHGLTLIYLLANASAIVSPVVGETARSWLGWSAAFAVASLGLVAAWTILHSHSSLLRAAEQSESVAPDASRDTPHGSLPLLLCLCLISLLFTVAHMQASTTLLLWAHDHTDRRFLTWELPVPYIASLHSGLVIAVSPLLSRLMSRVRTAPGIGSVSTKIAGGMAVTSLAYVPMIIAAQRSGGLHLVGIGWLLGCLLMLSIAELLVGALGPSFVLRLAPPQSGGRWIGAWYAATAVGFWVAGRIGGLWDRVPHSAFFLGLAVLPMIGVAVSLCCRRWNARH